MEHFDEWTTQYLDISTSSYTAQEFFHWHKAGQLHLSPDFQRGEVWKTPARSFLIDTILRGFPIPPLHIRLTSSTGGVLSREVIDGQQRLSAIIKYLEGDFAITRFQTVEELAPPWAGRRFSQLDSSLQERIQTYSFNCEMYKGQIADSVIREIFSRINMYSVPLSPQEIRNGKYFGEFKQAVYELAREHEKFWMDADIFTSTGIARMLDAQLVSELLALQISGQQDKKVSLDSIYHRFEEKWPERSERCSRFRHVMDVIRSTFGELLPSTSFRRPPFFYTLFAVVYHRLYGVDQTLPKDHVGWPESPRLAFTDDSSRRLADSLTYLTDVLTSAEVFPSMEQFRKASSGQTDNIRPRLIRFETLWEAADLGRP